MSTTKILLGVDTEADDQWSAAARKTLTVENARELPRLQALCDRYGVKPTYLVTYEMAVDGRAMGILRDLAATGRAEIATHHHPWSTPPEVDDHLYPLNLSPAHFREQLLRLTEAVTGITGIAPVSYRAGRNGFAGWQVPILEELGYRVDSSVDPFFNEKRKGGPSFAGARLDPYFVSPHDPKKAGGSGLLEIPVTSALDRKWPAWLETAYADVSSAYHFRRALRLLGIARPIWLRPSYSTAADMKRLARRVLEDGRAPANIIFHSSELLPGASPYNRTQEDLERFYRDLESLLAFLVENGATGSTFREFRESWH
jgi:peptidoglycan/xylan/chitin deacetylase (PgdA/CDA1 family)